MYSGVSSWTAFATHVPAANVGLCECCNLDSHPLHDVICGNASDGKRGCIRASTRYRDAAVALPGVLLHGLVREHTMSLVVLDGSP